MRMINIKNSNLKKSKINFHIIKICIELVDKSQIKNIYIYIE